MTKRFEILDVLKGFSLLAILVLHFLQQFEIENSHIYTINAFNKIEGFLKNTVTTFFSGNVYLIFSLIFGINLNFGLKNKSNSKFLVRLLLIFVIGYLHSLLYLGDILILYAILGVVLLFLNKFNNKVLLIVLTISLLQLPILFLIYQTIFTNYELVTAYDLDMIKEMNTVYTTKGFWDVIEFNAINGRYLSMKQYLFSGRFLNIFSFFVIGLLIFKNKILEQLENKKAQIIKVIYASLAVSLVLIFIGKINFSANIHVGLAVKILIISLTSLSSSIFYTALLTYLYYFTKLKFNFFTIYGKPSLTIYLTQSIFGVVLFYYFGFNLGNAIGFLQALVLAVIVVLVQYYFVLFWFKKHKKGPFEMASDSILNAIKV